MELTRHEALRRAGGAVRISRYLEAKGKIISPSAISKWPTTGFPRWSWEHIIELTKGLAPITADDLVDLHRRPEND